MSDCLRLQNYFTQQVCAFIMKTRSIGTARFCFPRKRARFVASNRNTDRRASASARVASDDTWRVRSRERRYLATRGGSRDYVWRDSRGAFYSEDVDEFFYRNWDINDRFGRIKCHVRIVNVKSGQDSFYWIKCFSQYFGKLYIFL